MKHTKVVRGNIVHAPKFGELEMLQGGYIVVVEGVIEGLYEVLPEGFGDLPIDDFGTCLVMPAFADVHMHAPQYPMLGMGMDLPLLDWLNTYTFRVESRFSDRDYAREVYRALARDLIRKGTTRVCAFSSLHLESTIILMEELECAGVTGFVGKTNMDRNSVPELQETTESSIRDTLAWLERCGQFRSVRPILTPRFTPSCTNELMQALGQIAESHKLGIQSHLSENTSEMAWVRELHPDCCQYWETYAKYGLFNARTVMAHCVHSDARERHALKTHGVLVAHCPDSNVNLVSGTAPVRRMLDEGLWVALGSDIAGGASLSMMDIVTSAIRSSKVRRIESQWEDNFLTVAEAFYLATSSGARYFGAGPGFSTGDKLHAVVVSDARQFGSARLSLRERFERSFYFAHEHEIVAVYSEGRQVL